MRGVTTPPSPLEARDTGELRGRSCGSRSRPSKLWKFDYCSRGWNRVYIVLLGTWQWALRSESTVVMCLRKGEMKFEVEQLSSESDCDLRSLCPHRQVATIMHLDSFNTALLSV